MGPFDLDFSHVRNVVVPPDRIPVLGNEHRMVRVAFDLFRLDGDKEERLWQVQTAEDGSEFLVRTYDLPEDVEDGLESRSSDWSVMTDAKLANLTIAYKRVPVHRLAAADYNAQTPDEVRLLRELVSEKLATDEAWAGRLLRDLPPVKLAALGEAFPELSKAAAACPACGKAPCACPEGCPACGKKGAECKCGTPPMADDAPDVPDAKALWDLRTTLAIELAGRAGDIPGNVERLSEEEQAAFRAAAEKLKEVEQSGTGLEEAEALVDKFEQMPSPQSQGRLEEGTKRMLRMIRYREMSAIGRLKEIAMEMGQSGRFERHELPMVVFYFHEGIGGEEKAKEFLAQADKIGYYGTLVGPGYAAVKLPGL